MPNNGPCNVQNQLHLASSTDVIVKPIPATENKNKTTDGVGRRRALDTLAVLTLPQL